MVDKRYVKCNCCGKRIYFGDDVFTYKGWCGVYCSADCFADTYSVVDELGEDVVTAKCCIVYDDDKRKRELMETMERLKREMDQCEMEFQSLTAQN